MTSGIPLTGLKRAARICPRIATREGVVERLNARIEDVLQSYRSRSGEDPDRTDLRHVRHYKGQLPRSVLKARTPVDVLKKRHR